MAGKSHPPALPDAEEEWADDVCLSFCQDLPSSPGLVLRSSKMLQDAQQHLPQPCPPQGTQHLPTEHQPWVAGVL